MLILYKYLFTAQLVGGMDNLCYQESGDKTNDQQGVICLLYGFCMCFEKTERKRQEDMKSRVGGDGTKLESSLGSSRALMDRAGRVGKRIAGQLLVLVRNIEGRRRREGGRHEGGQGPGPRSLSWSNNSTARALVSACTMHLRYPSSLGKVL